MALYRAIIADMLYARQRNGSVAMALAGSNILARQRQRNISISVAYGIVISNIWHRIAEA